jgi:manganese/zinc/iron transport system substrate-binding protein
VDRRWIVAGLAGGAVLVLGFLALGLAGCGNGDFGGDHRFRGNYPIRVLCTTGMVADLVRNVGGDKVEITQLMGEGVDPHRYKPSPGDVAQLNAADAIFYSGRNLEGKMTDLFVRMAKRKPTCAVTDGIDEGQVLEDAEGHYDPHLWFDVSLWAEGVGVVSKALSEFDPKNAEYYRKNAEAYRPKLDKLHEEVKASLAKIPKERRVMVTAHDAFRYFGRAYDIEVRGIQGISTESEAGVKEINDLVDFLTRRKVKAVFVETSVSPKNVRALIEGCASRGHKVVVGGELYSDAMGKPGTEKGTYPGMIRHNVKTIVGALK